MRLHIAQNEKIISRCIDNFDQVFPGDNKWIILPNSARRDYIGDRIGIVKCEYDSEAFRLAVGDVSQYEKIIIHFLTPDSAKFVCSIEHPSIYWIEWGADLYNELLYLKGFPLYEDEIRLRKYSRYGWMGSLYTLIHRARKKKRQKLYLTAAKKMKYFVPDSMYDEYPMLLDFYPELKQLEYREFYYYPINEVLGEGYQERYTKGDNIILGNSASLTGNHYEALDLLSKINLQDRKIIIPLSYGSVAYADDIEAYGLAKMRDSVHTLREYMALDKYNEILESANIFVYNSYRQEAVGNILVALYLGGKVFLNERNPLLPFYKRLGLAIYPLGDLSKSGGLDPLSKEDVDKNREILMKLYSRERQLQLIKDNM